MTDTQVNPPLLLLHYTTRIHLAAILIGAVGAVVAYAVTSSLDIALRVGGVVAIFVGNAGLLLLICNLVR